MSNIINEHKGICPACRKGKENKASEKHHIFPVEFGGAMDGQMISICSSCHTDLHEKERELHAGKRNATEIKAVCTPILASLIFKAYEQRMSWIRNKEEGVNIATDARRRLVVHLSEDEQKRVKILKSHFKYSNQEDMIRFLINREFNLIASGKL